VEPQSTVEIEMIFKYLHVIVKVLEVGDTADTPNPQAFPSSDRLSQKNDWF